MLAELRAYRGTEAYLAMQRFLKALQRSYGDDLPLITAETLARKQGAAAQCFLLYKALTDEALLEVPRV